MPSLSACWRKAPAVRFIILEIRATGVFAFECLRRSAWCARAHATRFFDLLLVLAFFAMQFSCCAGVVARVRRNGRMVSPAARSAPQNHPGSPLAGPFRRLLGATALNGCGGRRCQGWM